MGRLPVQHADTIALEVAKDRRYFYALRLAIVTLLWMIVAAFGVPIGLVIVPTYEARFLPVLENVRVTDVHPIHKNGEEFLGFQFDYDKRRQADIARIGFLIYSTPDHKFTTSVYRGWDCRRDFDTILRAPPGKDRTAQYCVEVPEPLRNADKLHVEIWGDYRTHGLWLVPQTFPMVEYDAGPLPHEARRMPN